MGDRRSDKQRVRMIDRDGYASNVCREEVSHRHDPVDLR